MNERTIYVQEDPLAPQKTEAKIMTFLRELDRPTVHLHISNGFVFGSGSDTKTKRQIANGWLKWIHGRHPDLQYQLVMIWEDLD